MFIELTIESNNAPISININQLIEFRPYKDTTVITTTEQKDYIYTKENYHTVQQKIKEALK